MSNLRKKIKLFISSLFDVTRSASHGNVTDDIIPNPTISFPQPCESRKDEKSKCDPSTNVDMWHEDMCDMDEQDDFIESLDISLIQSIMEPKVNVSTLSLESGDPTSLQFTALYPTPLPLLHFTTTISENSFNASKSLMLGTLDPMIIDNDFDQIIQH